MNLKSKIWVVWNPMHGPAQVRHYSYESAVCEAERMAALHKGSVFHVMESMGVALVEKPVVFKPFSETDGIPF